MAIFKNNSEEFNRLDWQILRGSWINLYHNSLILDRDIDWFKSVDYIIVDFDCTKWNDESVMHNAFKNQLKFPDYYGMNLDALNDCLSYLEISQAGLLIILRHFDKINNETNDKLIDIFTDVAREHMLFGDRFIILLQIDDPKHPFKRFGETTIFWNDSERIQMIR